MQLRNVHFLPWLVPLGALLAGASSAVLLTSLSHRHDLPQTDVPDGTEVSQAEVVMEGISLPNTLPNGRPLLSSLPEPEEVWECEVAVIGGSLGGVAAAAYAMAGGVKTCLIELTPWMGGQISSQGISAVDESETMLKAQNFTDGWQSFKNRILQEPVSLPPWTGVSGAPASSINSCWVGRLCFPPDVGAKASMDLLEEAKAYSPNSRWATSTAFKGAEFDDSGRIIEAVYGVRRVPRDRNYIPQGRLSIELNAWYGWDDNDTFDKIPIRLQPPPGKTMMVIDATDTGELVGWARIPYRLGSESWATLGETHASDWDNPECTQAFTAAFALGLYDDGGKSKQVLKDVDTFYNEEEHHEVYSLAGTSMFTGRSFFNYRRMVSTTLNDPFYNSPAPGDIALINWTQGNDWNWMNPPLILTKEKLVNTGHYQNWMGGISALALRHGENHSLMFAKWLLDNHTEPGYPLTFLYGPDGPMRTASGLAMVPYIREGRRILGRAAYGQPEFMIREQDIRNDMEGRDFGETAIAVTHYDIDIHGCRYRNWEPTGEAVRASVKEELVRPIYIPLEALIPQGVDNMLIGGKALAASHIATAAIRVHHGEWHVGAASGVTAAWLVRQHPGEFPAAIVPKGMMPALQQHLINQGLRPEW